MKRTVMLLLAASGMFLSSVTAHAQEKKPNIVIIWGTTSARPMSAPTRWD
jgi:hypothetical protein